MKILKTEITNIGDPFIVAYKGVYYHYSTSHENGFIVYISNDLKKWENKGLCYQNSKVGYQNFWAPEVYIKNEKFYMLFTSKNKESDYLTLSLAVSNNPLGPFIDVLDKPFYDFGYAAIDGHIFKDEDGQYYLYYARDCSQNIINGIHTSQIYGVKLNEDWTVSGEPKLLTTPSGSFETKRKDWQWNEGPFVLKHNGKYYLSYSVNCFDDKLYSVSYATSKDPLGEFIKARENPILTHIEGEISGPGHNMYFKTFEGELYTAFHIHTDINKPSGNRRTCFAKYTFIDNKLIIDYK